MSGQLVGEVINAAGSLRASGLSERGFHALIAIADKASSDRTASVRWDHIRAGLYGASKRTAQRAVDDLLAAGAIRIVKVGFRNQRTSRAPIYEILPFMDDASQVSSSTTEDRDSQVSSSSRADDDNPGSGSRQIESGSRHLGVLLDGSFDGSFDRAAVRDAIDECLFCDQFGRLDNLQDCPRHPNFRMNRTSA
ncbi:hypothetical protein [Mycolicibacterium celeriflavum]|uniref:hypothetical protein n=1 Tax=Mycolicibacterium celeriflavum TaxID=1249101 RepID=UPI003CECAF3B